ncbi:uncharacterized protein LOC113381902 [Ctenocephalides felis]|uniref:uncharacterized protein LOC113381902 n=1 Tax=Ctenocephalides felis TaxID=7515 RepID=UPI000E6E3737|nr:uncharacterized protein LOC113381902 [Ctenocephalides felis]
MNTLGKLMLLAKEQDSKIIINIFIKQSPMILKIFLKQGLSGLEVLLRNNTEDVTNILKTMQQSTRFINSICVQAKTTKDVALMSCVPTVLRILETIVYKVKAVLVANKCPTAFIMGNLINRNVKGEIIATQSTSVTESNNDSEDEFPPSNSESELESDSEPEECEKHGKTENQEVSLLENNLIS